MARSASRPRPATERTLHTLADRCGSCGGTLWCAYTNHRTLVTLDGPVRLLLKIRLCHDPACPDFRRPRRPEEEGRLALPKHEFGLDVVALAGSLRHAGHRSVPEIHAELQRRGAAVCQRTVTNLLDRYEELLALSLADRERLRRAVQSNGRVVLAIDGLQPDVGHEVLWVVRDCLSGEILLARSLLSARHRDLAGLLTEVRGALEVPVAGVVSDGQQSIRMAVGQALPGVPHQLCHFHYLREAARPVSEADRHAKKELKKRVRGVRKLERGVQDRADPAAEAVRGYCAAVRSAITDDGRPPLAASGLKLRSRLSAVAKPGAGRPKRGLPAELEKLNGLVRRGLRRTARLWPAVETAYRWVHRAAGILDNPEGRCGAEVRRRLDGLAAALRGRLGNAGRLAPALRHFLRVTDSYRPGLFHCYDVEGLPRTDNDLEHLFGSFRYHERRASGRRAAGSATVLRGPVRLAAAAATRTAGAIGAERLCPADLAAWRKLRADLEARRRLRTLGRRFRSDPTAYLSALEESLAGSG